MPEVRDPCPTIGHLARSRRKPLSALSVERTRPATRLTGFWSLANASRAEDNSSRRVPTTARRCSRCSRRVGCHVGDVTQRPRRASFVCNAQGIGRDLGGLRPCAPKEEAARVLLPRTRSAMFARCGAAANGKRKIVMTAARDCRPCQRANRVCNSVPREFNSDPRSSLPRRHEPSARPSTPEARRVCRMLPVSSGCGLISRKIVHPSRASRSMTWVKSTGCRTMLCPMLRPHLRCREGSRQ